MKIRILTLFFVLTSVVGQAQLQNTPPENHEPDKVVVFSFMVSNNTFLIDFNNNRHKISEVIEFIDANREYIDDGSMPIFVFGYCGKGGSEATRAVRVRQMSNQVKSEFIYLKRTKENDFVTSNSVNCYSDTLPNAVIIKFYPPFDYRTRQPKFTEKFKLVPDLPDTDSNKKALVATPPKSDILKAEAEAPKSEQTFDIDKKPRQPTAEPEKEQPAKKIKKTIASSWYVGGGVGMAFGRSTFASFAADKTRPGLSAGIIGGNKINKLLSAELSLDYTRMTLGAYDCCQKLYLGADGNRYFAPVTGMASYRYDDLLSTTHLIGLGAHLNVDLVSIWRDDSRWSALIVPSIYGVYSSAVIKQSGTKVSDRSTFHFGAGLDFGAQYRINDNWSLRLTSGVSYLTGAFDGVPQQEHKMSYVWNTTLKVIYKW